MKMSKLLKGTVLAAAGIMLLSASECSDANVASRNISEAADNFEIMRRVVFYNGITSEYIMTIEGKCSLGNYDSSLRMSVTCKDGKSSFKKHYLGLSDNVTFFAEQMDPVEVSVYHHRIIFKPQAILPDIDFKGSIDELLDNHNTDG